VDTETFAEAAGGLHVHLVRVVFLVCGDRELAEECAQEALIRAWSRADRGASLDSMTAWTTTVALNCCRSQLRRSGAEARALRRVLGRRTPGPAEPAGLSPDVHRAVLRLPLRQREVVVLHYLLDQDVATIARTAGITTGAVKNALFNARAALAAALDVSDAEPTVALPEESR
jgi:RNA polymerase sigma-70 factor (ECF subfamily)